MAITTIATQNDNHMSDEKLLRIDNPFALLANIFPLKIVMALPKVYAGL